MALRTRSGPDRTGQFQTASSGRTCPLAIGRFPPIANNKYRGPSLRQDPRPCGRLRGSRLPGRGRVVLDVMPLAEGEADATTGRWVLEAGTDGASCRRARIGEDADLRLGIAELGSLYMGGFPASLLAAGGRVEELRSGRLLVIDALLTTRPSPRSGTGF